MLKAISKVLLVLGIISIAVGVGLHEYYMRTQRLHIEGLTEQGVFVGLALILVGVIYAVTPSPFTKTFMVVLMILANVGFIAALWILSTESPRHPVYWQYLYYVKWVFLPPWLIINAAGTYFLFKTRKKGGESKRFSKFARAIAKFFVCQKLLTKKSSENNLNYQKDRRLEGRHHFTCLRSPLGLQ